MIRRREIRERRRAVLRFDKERLIYDIANMAYVEGDIMDADEHRKHQVYDIAEDGNRDRVERILDMAYARITEALYPYTKTPLDKEGEEFPDKDDESTEYVIELDVPVEMGRTTITYLKGLIREYMTCRVLSDWTSVTCPSSSAGWGDKAEEALYELRVSLVSRARPVKRKMRPF